MDGDDRSLLYSGWIYVVSVVAIGIPAAYVLTSFFLWTSPRIGPEPSEIGGGIGTVFLGTGVLLGIVLGRAYLQSDDRSFLYAVWVHYASVVVVGLLATIALHAAFEAALSAAGLEAAAASTAGGLALWGLAVARARALAGEVAAVLLDGYGALTRGSPPVAVARSVFLTGLALAAVAAVTWVGLSAFRRGPEPIAIGVATFVGLGWLLVCYRTARAFVGGLRADAA